ncbi:MAG: hypothetical protein COB36_11030 [Alphaproteobacteria bacterium]|nr:MAG: hypothetical protein COB36_11030 [Alphaproteobacteria bacterium]
MKKVAEHLGVWGGSGSGKSTFLKEKIAKRKRVICLDPMGDWAFEKGFRSFKTKARMYSYMRENWHKGYKVVLLVDEVKTDPQALLIEVVTDIMYTIQKNYKDSNGAKDYEITLLIDELADFLPNITLKPSQMVLKRLMNKGRHYGVDVFGASQRIADVHLSFRANSTENFFFRQDEDVDRKRILGAIGREHRADLMSLGDHEYLNFKKGVVTKGKNKCNFKRRR